MALIVLSSNADCLPTVIRGMGGSLVDFFFHKWAWYQIKDQIKFRLN